MHWNTEGAKTFHTLEETIYRFVNTVYISFCHPLYMYRARMIDEQLQEYNHSIGTSFMTRLVV